MNSPITIAIPAQDIEIDQFGTGMAEAEADIDLPARNYTVFVRAFEHVVMGKEKPLHHHAMSKEEYDRFVNDMWIGIVLTMVVVFIVFALCFWYMYHKFQLWKRHYDARARLRANGQGMGSNDLETLPNYSLVSGLPTYDDAIEQLRLSNTNHRLIKHQTIMKFFDSVNEKLDRAETPLPSYEDAITKAPSSQPPPSTTTTGKWASSGGLTSSAASNVSNSKTITYTILPVDNHTNIDSIGNEQTTANAQTISTVQADRLRTPPTVPIALKSKSPITVTSSNGDESVSITGGEHRFKCTLIPEPSVHIPHHHHHHHHHRPAIQNQYSLPIGSSLGSLNIINEIKNSKPDVPWMHHGSTLSLSLDYDSTMKRAAIRNEHRASLH